MQHNKHNKETHTIITHFKFYKGYTQFNVHYDYNHINLSIILNLLLYTNIINAPFIVINGQLQLSYQMNAIIIQ